MMALPFVPGYPSQSPRLLERFLPPLQDGIAAHYIQKHTQPGDLVLDPFGQSPSLAVEALSLDRRLLVASFNPVSRLALSLAVRPPSMTELRSALTQLADARVGRERGDRLERHVRDLYRTTCAVCQGPANADAFEWDAEADVPVEKLYYCPQCGAARQSATDEEDKARARRHGRTGLDFYYLLDRVAALGDPDRPPAEEAMAVYPARTLAAVGAVLNKVEALSADRETRRLLAGLLVAALDQCTVLAQERPKALVVPPRYRETNFWLALERGLGIIAGAPAPDRSLTLAQALSREARSGIHAYAGSVRELAALVPAAACSLLISVLPRPNQAYWALSAVWSAWLWGRESSEALRAVLRRRRYDWAWHAKALERSLAPLADAPRFRGRLVTLLAEAEPGFSASAIAAAAGAGYLLDAAALRADSGEAQAEWLAPPRSPARPPTGREAEIHRASGEALEACLRARAEPTRWISLHFAAWTGLARRHLLAWQPDDPLGAVQAALDDLAEEESRLEHLAATSASEAATGRWYLRQPGEVPAPLADRVEAEVVRLLSAGDTVDEHEVDLAVCARFPGDETPGHGLVAACLASYAERLESGLWQLRPEDAPNPRAEEAEAMQSALKRLAQHHGFAVDGDNPQVWQRDQRAQFYVAILTSAAISPCLLGPHPSAQNRYLVLPGGRAGLVEYKLRRDPRLRRALLDGAWSIVKFRHIRRIVAEAQLTGAALETALAGDPLEGMQQLVLVP